MLKLIKKHQEELKYLFFGGVTTLVNWIVYAFVVGVVHIEMTVGNALAWICAVAVAYVTNRAFVFGSEEHTVKGILKEISLFVGARTMSGFVEIFLPTSLFKIGLDQSLFGIQGFVAKLIVSVMIVVLNYFFSKWFIFRKS